MLAWIPAWASDSGSPNVGSYVSFSARSLPRRGNPPPQLNFLIVRELSNQRQSQIFNTSKRRFRSNPFQDRDIPADYAGTGAFGNALLVTGKVLPRAEKLFTFRNFSCAPSHSLAVLRRHACYITSPRFLMNAGTSRSSGSKLATIALRTESSEPKSAEVCAIAMGAGSGMNTGSSILRSL
jgi:hypothetical protein